MTLTMAATFRTLAAAACLALFGCSKKPTETQVQASAVIESTFLGSQEYIFAARKLPGSTEVGLVEFHNPTTALRDRAVSETDQMNGVTARVMITLNADQVRYWDGTWSEWRAGTGQGGANSLINAMVGGLLGDWVTVLERKNGEWHQRDMTAIRDFVQDKELLQSMIRSAGD